VDRPIAFAVSSSSWHILFWSLNKLTCSVSSCFWAIRCQKFVVIVVGVGLLYKSFIHHMGSKQTNKDRQKTIQWQNTREQEKKKKKAPSSSQLQRKQSINSLIKLVEHDNLWTNDDLRCLSSMFIVQCPIIIPPDKFIVWQLWLSSFNRWYDNDGDRWFVFYDIVDFRFADDKLDLIYEELFENAHKSNHCLHELFSSYVHRLESLRPRCHRHDLMLPACTGYLH